MPRAEGVFNLILQEMRNMENRWIGGQVDRWTGGQVVRWNPGTLEPGTRNNGIIVHY
jgi:hypothetical protein